MILNFNKKKMNAYHVISERCDHLGGTPYDHNYKWDTCKRMRKNC